MFIPVFARPLVAALLLSALPAIGQTKADDPAAAVPETRYQPAHIQPAPAKPAATPDRNWQESNRIVAGQPAHAGHGAHGAHGAPAPAKEAPAADPHAGHHDHGDHH